MPEAEPPPSPPSTTAERGAARFVWFAGLLEGSPRDRGEIERIVAQIRALDLIRVDLEIDRGHFSVLLDERAIPGTELSPERQRLLTALLEALVTSAEESAPIDSTLRRTEVYQVVVVETLFTPQRGQLQEVQRERAIEPADLARQPQDLPPSGRLLAGFGPGRLAVLGMVLVTALAMLAWQSGLLDLVASSPAEDLEVRQGPFDRLLSARVEDNWGNYRLRIRRGADFPATGAAANALLAGAASPLDRAAAGVLVDGGRIHARLLDAAGEVLNFTSVPLAPLLVGPDAEIEAVLPGRRTAAAVELALSSR